MIRGKFFVGSVDDLTPCFEIRRKVFVEEQKIPEEEEFDGVDETCGHYVIYDEKDLPVATGRLIRETDRIFHIGRVATLKAYRHQGYGEFLMLSLIEKARSLGAEEIHLIAQLSAARFYEKCGFEAVDNKIVIDAGIEHIKMKHIIGLHKKCCDCK